MAKLIAHECVAHDHQPTLAHPDKLTIHRGAWAFCPFDARAGGHEWRETGGATLDELSRRCGLGALPNGSSLTTTSAKSSD